MTITNKQRDNTNYTTRGGQITLHNIRMFLQIQGGVFKWAGVITLIIAFVYTYFLVSYNEIVGAFYYIKFHIYDLLMHKPSQLVTITYDGVTYQNTLSSYMNNPIFHEHFSSVLFHFQVALLGSGFSVGLIAAFVIFYFKRKGLEQTEDVFIRGVKIVTPIQLSKILKKAKKRSDFTLDGLKIFKKNFEVQHVLLDGTTGSGKSVALRKILKWIKKRGDKAIVYDKGCTFVGKFYDPATDVILNPFDERSAAWDVWCDAENASDFENEATALIPQQGEGDPFWVLAARTIFTSTAYKMKDEPDKNNERFLEMMLTSDLEELGKYLEGTESNSLVSDKAAKIAISIKSILAAYIKSLRFLEGLDKPDKHGNARPKFSIKKWVQDDNKKGVLFLSSNAQQHASLRPLISMWLSIASTSLLGLKENPNRRIWVIMDEMPTLHKLPELAETISEVRKFGGCYILGIQSYAQLKKNYGQNTADEIFDLLNTRLFYRAPSKAMAKISSDDLGEQEIDVSKEQYSYGAETIRDGVSLGHQTITRPAVTPTEIQQLEDLEFWMNTPGNFPITKVTLKYDTMKNIHQPFIPREFPSSKKGKELDELIAWHQVAAIGELDDSERNTLINVHNNQYDENEDSERKDESNRMIQQASQFKSSLSKKANLDKNKEDKKKTDKEIIEKEDRDRVATQEMLDSEKDILSPSTDHDVIEI